MFQLIYKSNAQIEDLGLNECTMHRASNSGAARWWLLWFKVLRDSDGQPEVFCVPMNPGGSYTESGAGGRTWGLLQPDATPFAGGPGTKVWQVSPSINVLGSGDAHAGPSAQLSLWHQTPAIVNVPDSEPWAQGAAP